MSSVQLNSPTTLGSLIATEDIGGIQHQKLIAEFSDGVGGATMVSAADPLPTTDAAVLAKLSADPSTETTLAALLAKVIAAPSTEAKQDATNVLLTTIAAITQPLTDVELRATPVPISGTVAVTGAGDATAANQTTEIALLADIKSFTGGLTETAPATDTASSGLNGRLQRIAQRITSLITALGSPFQAGGSIGNTAFGVNNAAGASAVNIQDGGNSVTVDSPQLPAALVTGRLDVNVGARVVSTPTKAKNITVFTLASTAASSVAISSDVDVSTIWGASFFIRFGRRSASAAGAGVNIRIEGSFASSGNNTWIPLAVFTTNFAACEAEAVSGTVSSGTNVITVASTTNLTAGDIIYIDNGTIANSEWARIKSISANVSVTIEDNLVNAQTGATIYDSAEMYVAQLDLSSIGRIRVVVDGSLFTQANTVEVKMVTLSSIV